MCMATDFGSISGGFRWLPPCSICFYVCISFIERGRGRPCCRCSPRHGVTLRCIWLRGRGLSERNAAAGSRAGVVGAPSLSRRLSSGVLPLVLSLTPLCSPWRRYGVFPPCALERPVAIRRVYAARSWPERHCPSMMPLPAVVPPTGSRGVGASVAGLARLLSPGGLCGFIETAETGLGGVPIGQGRRLPG
jgi:hypothetical protein